MTHLSLVLLCSIKEAIWRTPILEMYTTKIHLILRNRSCTFQQQLLSLGKNVNVQSCPTTPSQMDEVLSLAILVTFHVEGGSLQTKPRSVRFWGRQPMFQSNCHFFGWFMCESVSPIQTQVNLFLPEPGSYQSKSVSSNKYIPVGKSMNMKYSHLAHIHNPFGLWHLRFAYIVFLHLT